VEKLLPIHSAQLMTYMRLKRAPSGLLDQLQRSYAGPGDQENSEIACSPCRLRGSPCLRGEQLPTLSKQYEARVGRE
jgi:hypothetical protein